MHHHRRELEESHEGQCRFAREPIDLSSEETLPCRFADLLVEQLHPAERRDPGPLGDEASRPEEGLVGRGEPPHLEEAEEQLFLADMDGRGGVGLRQPERLVDRRQQERPRSGILGELRERAPGMRTRLIPVVLVHVIEVEVSPGRRPLDLLRREPRLEQRRDQLDAEDVSAGTSASPASSSAV